MPPRKRRRRAALTAGRTYQPENFRVRRSRRGPRNTVVVALAGSPFALCFHPIDGVCSALSAK
jgi:hypothetical protein